MGDVSRLLLDSHILLWYVSEPDRLSAAQTAMIVRSEVYISAATAWELEIKRAKGKLTFEGPVPNMLKTLGFIELPITIAHGVRAAGLPMLHKDPFDRMLVAQALADDLVLVTADAMLARYGVQVLM